MIEKIQVRDVATYGASAETLNDLAKINFVYGANGTGKTTISRIIANAASYPHCALIWRNAASLETLVYNRDFVDKNFNQADELKGIFTLGEKVKGTFDKIKLAKQELDGINKSIAGLNFNLRGSEGNGGKVKELDQLEDEFADDCWQLKVRHDAKFQGAFAGSRRSKKDFKRRLLVESLENSAAPVPLEDLERRAATVFAKTPLPQQILRVPILTNLIAHESNSILKKEVIGKSNGGIAGRINKLGNSDWVRQGRRYYDPEERICPFCQQNTVAALENSLNDYFDEAFESDLKEIERLGTEYRADSEDLNLALQALLDNPSEHLETGKLAGIKNLLDSRVSTNMQRIEQKRRAPSESVELESMLDIRDEINILLDAANAAIHHHNTMVANIQIEKSDLTGQIWRHLLDHDMRGALTSYNKRKAKIQAAITNINEKLDNRIEEKRRKEQDIRNLERSTASIQPTVDEINAILASFGFQGFTLSQSERPGFYKIRRSDGSDAKATLSEGERSFIAFLYFYHLIGGSASGSDMTSDRVVVFDDPVSSLDSNVLFVVSSLIKELFKNVRDNDGSIKQIFVLTHNAYFHKEVSYNSRRRAGRKFKDETFWTVRREELVSKIESHETNPIRSTYELLWKEVRESAPSSPALPNTMRRILEHYFTILGNIDTDDIMSKFSGRERLICKSLFSWVNEGSHGVHDDPSYSPNESVVKTHLRVFEKIFRKTGHIGHYNMMTGNDAAGEADVPYVLSSP